MPIVASPAQTIVYGPFIIYAGVAAASISGGSALFYKDV